MTDNRLVASQNHFAFKLFTTLAERERGKNIFISPTSVALALALAANGARGATWRAIAQALELGDLDTLNRANADLMQTLSHLDPQIKLAIANSLWVRNDIALDPEFLHHCQTAYNAQVANLDFASPKSVSTINDWVAHQTNGKIGRIVDRIGRDALLFLINAIYFKGSWARQFDTQLTEERPFTPLAGQPKSHPMMSQHGTYRYYESGEFQAISLPYGSERVTMDIFLPAQQASLAAFCQALSSPHWQRWQAHFAKTEGAIQLPRFKLAYETSLNDALKSLGMDIAFGPGADFSGMCRSETKVHIDEVKHKTFVEVNEAGTEAAAVTSVGMVRASFMPKKTFRMIVDRPFFCAIRDTQTGAILFMGAIVDPSAER
jgi:serine protease inhibitor